jgi:hypothetical protein
VTVEERLRATTEAVTAAMRPVRPLDLPPSRSAVRAAAKYSRARSPRRWPGWLVPLTAAVAVIAVAATLVAVRGLTGAGSEPQVTPASSSTSAAPLTNSVPRYYVDFGPTGRNGRPTQNAVLADTSTGKQLATFSPPPNDMFSYTAAAADDKTFVLLAYPLPGVETSKAGQSSDVWYVLRLPPGAPQRARLTRIPIAALSADTAVIGLAVSPDGRTLAVLFQVTSRGGSKGQFTYQLTVRTYSLATGQALRTWSEPTGGLAPTGPGTFNLSWLNDGRTLAFVAATRTAPQEIRFLNTSSPGTSLISDSRLVVSTPANTTCGSLLLTPDGKTFICGSAAPNEGSCAKGQVDMAAYSVATGKLERVLYRYRGGCQPVGSVQVMWAGSGTLAIGALFVGSARDNRVGLMSPGKFTPLPILSNGDAYGPGSIAF